MEELLVVEGEEEMEEVRSEELLVGLPEGINPRCVVTVVPPSGHIQRNCPNKSSSGKGLRVLRSLNPVHPLCADRSP